VFSVSPFGLGAVLLGYVEEINITLAALNLIPIPPLDGSKILMGIAPGKTRYFLTSLEPYGFFIIIGLLYLGMLNPLIGFIREIIGKLIGILLP
jgi:Zn-dependent protease